MKELPEEVQEKLAEAVELYVDEHLIGKPRLLATILFLNVASEMLKQINKIEDTFK